MAFRNGLALPALLATANLFRLISSKRWLVESYEYPNSDELLEKVEKIGYKMPRTKDGPVIVKIGFHIESLSNFGTASMSFDIDIYFRGTWLDTRFVHNSTLPMVITRKEHIKNLWIPDIYFVNARRSWFQDILRPNTYVRIFGNGEIFYSTRITLELSCNQDLRKYPMDRQICGAIIQSYSHSTAALKLQWMSKSITANANILLPELAVVGEQTSDCTTSHNYAETDSYVMHVQVHPLSGCTRCLRLMSPEFSPQTDSEQQANFSCLSASIVLQRQVGHHIVQTYVPTALIVIVSWVSFCIEPTSVAARVTLSFTTLLTLSTIASGVRMALPPVAYAKAVDIWISACIMFVFMSLIEFAVVNSFVRAAADIEVMVGSTCFDEVKEKDIQESESLLKQRLTKTASQKRWIALRIDYACRGLFPLVFAVFNVCYWCYYLEN